MYLAGSSGNLLHEIQFDWRVLSSDVEELNTYFSSHKKLEYTVDDKKIFLNILSATLEKANGLSSLLRKMEKMLESSIASTTFPESKIAELKGNVTKMQSALEGNIKRLKDLRQSIVDFDIRNAKNISDAKMLIAVKESELLAQKSKNLAVANNNDSTSIAIRSELAAAKNAYLNAENALAVAKSRRVSIAIQGDLAIQSAIAQVDAASAMVDQALLALSKLTISSGISGTVTKILARAGDTVSPGTPLVIVSDYSKLKLVSDVSLEESFLLKKGMEAEVSVDGIDKVFMGEVFVVYPEADKTTRRVRVEIMIPNTERLPANVFATARIVLPPKKSEVYVKPEWLISQNPPVIMVAEKKKCEVHADDCIEKYNGKQIFVLRKHEVAFKNNEETEFGLPVEKGLHSNQFIVVEKGKRLFEGDNVLIIQEDKEQKRDTEKEGEKSDTSA